MFDNEEFEFYLPAELNNLDITIVQRNNQVWPKPQVLKVSDNKIKIPNSTGTSVLLRKNQHFAEITTLQENSTLSKQIVKNLKIVQAEELENPQVLSRSEVKKVYDTSRSDLSHLILPERPKIDPTVSYLSDIQVDPDDQLSSEWKEKFSSLCKRYSSIITPAPGRYNGYFGHVDNSLHFSSTPAPVKARLPNYSYEKLLIQAKEMDKMEQFGVLAKPEDLGIVPIHVVPSMLVPKQEPGEYRVVSDFNSLNTHIRKPEVILQTMEATKQILAEYEFHAELDLSNYYWKGGMLREDCRYLATPHPFGGLRIYTVEPQGLKGASEHGSERLARVFGDMERDKKTVRHADGIYVLGNSEEEVFNNLAEVFERAKLSGLTFKPKKIVIMPKQTQMFGWIKNGVTCLNAPNQPLNFLTVVGCSAEARGEIT